MFTQLPLCQTQGAQTKTDASTTIKAAHPEVSRGRIPCVPPHRSEHTSSKRSWFSRCADFSLPPLLPAAQAEDHLLLFLALRKSPSSCAGRQPDFLPDSIGIALTISIWPTDVEAALYFPNGAPWSPLKANGFHPGLPAVSPSLLPFPSCLAHCYFDVSSRRGCLCQILAHWPLGQLLFRGPGGQGLDRFAHGSVLAGDEYMWGLSYSPKGTLDTSPIRLPHTIVQTLAQIQSQLPGLGQRLFVKESQSQVCPCPVEVSGLLFVKRSGHQLPFHLVLKQLSVFFSLFLCLL